MATILQDLATEISKALISCAPMGAWVAATFDSTIAETTAAVLPRRERKSIDRLSKRVAASVRARACGAERNPGSANSAAYDVLHSIAHARVNARLLVEHNLDASALASWMMDQHPPVDLHLAGGERRRNYTLGINEYCAGLTAAALELPRMQVSVWSEILRRQAAISEALALRSGPEGGE